MRAFAAPAELHKLCCNAGESHCPTKAVFNAALQGPVRQAAHVEHGAVPRGVLGRRGGPSAFGLSVTDFNFPSCSSAQQRSTKLVACQPQKITCCGVVPSTDTTPMGMTAPAGAASWESCVQLQMPCGWMNMQLQMHGSSSSILMVKASFSQLLWHKSEGAIFSQWITEPPHEAASSCF